MLHAELPCYIDAKRLMGRIRNKQTQRGEDRKIEVEKNKEKVVDE